MASLAETRFLVVVSEDNRFSVWPSDRQLPWGWRVEGFEGPRAECLAHIEAVWTELGSAEQQEIGHA
ncbi:MAG: MbtH family NRPS accessory protein [Pseudomonadota bacterium]